MILDADFKEVDHTLNADFGEYGAVTPVVDQTYKPESSNAQSGKAVAEAIASVGGNITVDHNFVDTSKNPQSGIAVAEAIGIKQNTLVSGLNIKTINGESILCDGYGDTNIEISIPEGGSGENGATFTPNVSADGVISWTNDKGLSNPTPVNIKGEKGEQGIQGVQGEKGNDGAKGDKGDKGDKGETGSAGKDGTNGKDGTSVTVKSVTESTADGGSNVVTFSDGKTVTIKNGSKGSKGDKGDPYTLTEEDKAEIVDELTEREVEILMPSYAVATVGVEFNIYHKNIVWSTKPIECYGLKWTISNSSVSIQRFAECLRIAPTSANVGEHTLKLQVKNPITNAVVTEKEMKLIICERTAVTGKNVVYMGDSLTYSRQGLYPAEIQYNLSSGGIVSVGTQAGTQATNQIGAVQHEGYNGATCGGFLNANVTNGFTNPFYNTTTKTFDFAQFVNTVGKTIHAVCLNLGANNLGNDIQGVADLKTIISKIRTYSTDLPIIVSLAPQTAGQDSWKGGVFTATEMRYHWRNLIKNFMNTFDSKLSNVYISTPYFNVDPDNDFPAETVARCSRDTTQISRQNDSLHPTRIGTLKMADSYYATLLYILSQNYVPEEPEEPEPTVVNLVDPTTANDSSPDTTTLFKDEWLNGYYLSASNISAKAGCIVTNIFPHTNAQTLKIEGVLLNTAEQKNRFRWYHFDANGDRPWPSYINYATGENGSADDIVTIDAENNTITVKCSSAKVYSRFSCYIAGSNEDVKVTVVE